MRISLNWIQEFLPTELDPQRIAELLTDIGLEVEAIEHTEAIPGGLAGVVVAHVLSVRPHPNADKLRICEVDAGAEAPLQIVCGAANVAAGQKVALATIGATLYPAGGEPFTIKKSKIRGEESFGMICAEDELGLGAGHEGILVLDGHLAVGTPLAQALSLQGEVVFEIGLTPNRTDAMGHYGVAVDLGAALRREARSPEVPALASAFPCPLKVRVEDTDRCPRYSGVVIRNIRVGESPEWLKKRLAAMGAKSINNVVDVTNYVLYEYGHPLHAFDLSAFPGGELVVKTATAGTAFTTLDGQVHQLMDTDLLITNGKDPLCLGGVMGGLSSGTTFQTTSIFLECAAFAPDTVRKTSKQHQVFSESAYRFARGVDPGRVPQVLQRAAALICELAGGEVSEVVDLYPRPDERPAVTLHFEKLNQLAGAELPREEVEQILHLLGFHFVQKNRQYLVLQVPGSRRDVYRFQDVAEEVLRIYGLNNIALPEKLNAAPVQHTATAARYHLQQRVADGLAAVGYREIRTNSLGPATAAGEDALQTRNPLSEEVSVLRTSLLPSGLEVIAHNLNRQQNDLCLYEFGRTYHLAGGQPLEQRRLALFQTGQDTPDHWLVKAREAGIFSLRRELNRLQEWLGLSLQTQELKDDPQLAYGLALVQGKRVWARIGRVKPELCKAAGISEAVYWADVDWQFSLENWEKARTTYRELPRFPAVRRDLSMLVQPGITFAHIAHTVQKCDNRRVQQVELFDVYRPKDDAETSYAISITLQDAEQTLTDAQLQSFMEQAIQQLEATGKVTIRR
ncbi:MAG: phenylalanine--tRNA ligase subunit beta [Bacteroidetes bacterium]|nr:phenylalanine--tRNA ligase subunit beta [Bacteroidota bacterium]